MRQLLHKIPVLFLLLTLPTWDGLGVGSICAQDTLIVPYNAVELTPAQLQSNPTYLFYPAHMQGKMPQMRCFVPLPSKPIGLFSVSEERYVSFSQGNLQYIHSQDRWHFADNQWEIIGDRNIRDGQLGDTIDLFGWSAKDSQHPFGVSTSNIRSEYQGDFLDWGTNTIDGDACDQWRTMTAEEWHYLLHKRANAAKLFALATVNEIPGLILLPDDWQCPENVQFTPSTQRGMYLVQNKQTNYRYLDYYTNNTAGAYHYNDNIYTAEQWDELANAGAVFIPSAGWREKNVFKEYETVPMTQYCGIYWTSTVLNSNSPVFFRPCDFEITLCYNNAVYRGRSVRLVHDTVPDPPPALVDKNYRYGFTQQQWDEANHNWGHQGRAHAPADQAVIQGTWVYGVRLKIGKKGTLNVYKVPTLLQKNEDHFELVATLKTDSMGVQDFDFPEPVYVGETECLVFGKPSDEKPTLTPCYLNKAGDIPQPFAHYIGTEKAEVGGRGYVALMVEFY